MSIATGRSGWNGSPLYVDETARIYGDVRFADDTSVWCNAVIRAESTHVEVGTRTNIQDFVMIHVGYTTPTIIGADCSITHHATLHGCTIGDKVLVGINATIMDGAVIGANSIIAGGAFVNERVVIPPNSVVMGLPAKVVRSRDCGAENAFNAWLYMCNARAYTQGNMRVWSDAEFLAAAAAKRAELGL